MGEGNALNAGEQPTWAFAERVFLRVLTQHYERRGISVETPSAASTLATNTTLVPQRGRNILQWLESLADRGSLRGARVLELGSGFGALAMWLLLGARASSVTALEINEEYLSISRDAARRVGVEDRLRFEHLDMERVGTLESGDRFDVVIANNALIYLLSADSLQATLEGSYELLAPDGVFFAHQANKWQAREPFTQAPLVHLLSPWAADRVGRVTGWRHNHGRVRLQSPRELRRRLAATGFERVRIAGANTPGRVLLSRFIVATAKKPSASP